MKDSRGYQLNYLKEHQVLKDVENRTRKFRKILSVIKDFCSGTESLSCLDVGCSTGIMASHMAGYFSMVVGIDIDEEAVRFAKEHASNPNVHFLVADSMALPFRKNTFDTTLCNHIYEHVPAAEKMMSEIERVIKQKGFCYFSGGNKYMLIEGHYGLPFLSWLPKPLAHSYLRLTGKGRFYYEEHLSLNGLRKLVRNFKIHDYTLAIISDPEKFSATDMIVPQSAFHKWLKRWAGPLYSFLPTYIWVLTKR